MEFTYSASAAYDLADLVLKRFESAGIMPSESLDQLLGYDKYSSSARNILNGYKLIDSKFVAPRVYSIIYYITENGKKALASGGIRPYILDYDLSFSIIDNFPRAIQIEKGGLLYGTYIVRSESELQGLKESFDPSQYVHIPRLSLRPSISLNANTPQMNNSQNTYNYGTIIKDSQNNNTNSQINANPQPERADKPVKEGRWTKIGVVFAVFTLAATIVGVYFAWKALAPGH